MGVCEKGQGVFEDGWVRCRDGVIVDITDRKRIEAAGREREEWFCQVAEQIPATFWLSDPETNRISYVSPGCERILGYPRETLYASPRAWLNAVHPTIDRVYFERR